MSDSRPIKDTDFVGKVERCGICGCDYVHPDGAVAGLGKCHDCFFMIWDSMLDQAREENAKAESDGKQ
jgi:hypothetical protein